MKIGDIVVIKECHAMPDLVGREAKIIVQTDPEYSRYPFQVILTGDPVKVTVNLPFVGEQTGETHGPFPFREEELELAKPLPEIPQAFKDMDNPS